MKKTLLISLLTILIFVSVTLLTAKIERPFDGNDTYGFPLTFHTKFSGMCDQCPPNLTATNYWNLALDIGLSLIGGLILSIGINIIRIKIRKLNT